VRKNKKRKKFGVGEGRKIKKGGEEGKEKGTEFVLIRESEWDKGEEIVKHEREMMGTPGNGKERKGDRKIRRKSIGGK
jgi:hypothetical protein